MQTKTEIIGTGLDVIAYL